MNLELVGRRVMVAIVGLILVAVSALVYLIWFHAEHEPWCDAPAVVVATERLQLTLVPMYGANGQITGFNQIWTPITDYSCSDGSPLEWVSK